MSNRLIDVPINNEELLEVLNKFKWFFDERRNLENFVHVTCEGDRREDFIGDNAQFGLEYVMGQGHNHEGFPDSLKAYSLDSEKIVNNVKKFDRHGDAKEAEQQLWLAEATKNYSLWNKELIELLCVRNNALAALYPPKGYISWHNNANASAYNFIFTWSEHGDGYFDYVDTSTGEVVRIPDVKGWQCKAGYFGSYAEHEDKLVYHSAATDTGWRLTISFMLDQSDLSLGMQEDVISEIKGEF